MNKICSVIEEQDLFAVPVTFSFNRKGSDHKTVAGGCLSILIKLTLLAYTVLLTKTMIGKLDNKNETYEDRTDEF